MVRATLVLVALVCLAAPAAVAAPAEPAAKPAEVSVRVERIEYPVSQAAPPAAYPNLKVNPRLAGKAKYVTDAVVLENEYLQAMVLPEFGARLPRITFKKPHRDLLWVNDVLEDNVPWSMGGTRFPFPLPDGGRHMDEAAGYRIVREADGSVTVAMDLRFSQYKDETGRYGRFSALRQATYVTLRPGAAWIEYVARVDNPLPLRHGVRLWNVAQFPRQPGAEILLPAGGVTEPGAAAMHPWPKWDEVDHSRVGGHGLSLFSVDTQGDWAGVYYPEADANHLVLKPRYTAPGAGVTAGDVDLARPARRDGMIEIWTGSNMLREHPGHYLPPFGTYVMPLRFALVTGIGRVDWANANVALSYAAADKDGPARVRIAGFEARGRVLVTATAAGETFKAEGPLRPGEPLVLTLGKQAEPAVVKVATSDGEDLAEVTLPWRTEAVPEETFRALQKEVRARDWMAAEIAEWPREVGPSLADAPALVMNGLGATKAEQAVQAARILMRTEAPPSPRWQTVRGLLESAARGEGPSRYVPMYLAMMMTLESGGRPDPAALALAAKAEPLPGAHYLAAFGALGSKDPAAAVPHLRAAIAMGPDVALGLGSLGIEGNDRRHPAATLEGEWPTLLLAAVCLRLNQPEGAIQTLQPLLKFDPARPEALALLAEAYDKAGDSRKALKASIEARGLFQMNAQAEKDCERLLREAKEGVWSGIPRPEVAPKTGP